jgi:hypothetical protein
MTLRHQIGAFVLASALSIAVAHAQALDESRYPDWKGQWARMGGASFDPDKPNNTGQQPPLTAEYQKIWEANMAEEASGGQDYNPQVRCLPGGMPREMIVYEPGMETVITPDTTYIYISFNMHLRRIFTDGRGWPDKVTPTFAGYSIGRWIDQAGDGRYSALEVETRGLKGPRLFEASGIPLHRDNATVVKERLFLDRGNPDTLHDEITVFDHALTRPWIVTRSYRREQTPTWIEHSCNENNQYVFVGKETYFRSADGNLMPSKKDQAPPDLRYFEPSPR